MTTPPVANLEEQTVVFQGTTFRIQPVSNDNFVALVDGVPVGRIVYTFGAANGVPEGGAISEDTLTAVAEAWFGATSQD
jgi:hypothetical protein